MGNYYLLSVDADRTQIKCYDPDMPHGNEFRTLADLGKTETEDLCSLREEEEDWCQTVLSYIPLEEDRKEPELWLIVGWERLFQNRKVLFTDDLLLVSEQKAMEAGENLQQGLELLVPHLLQDYRLGKAWIESFMTPEIGNSLKVQFSEICGPYISSMWNIDGNVKQALEEWKAGQIGANRIIKTIIKKFEDTCFQNNMLEQREKTMAVAERFLSALVHELESRAGCSVNLYGEGYMKQEIVRLIKECVTNRTVEIEYKRIIDETLYPFVQNLRDHNRILRFTNTREQQLARVLPEMEQKLKWGKSELREEVSWALEHAFMDRMATVYRELQESIVKECSCSCRSNIIESLDPHYVSKIFKPSIIYSSPRIEREQYLGELNIFWGKTNRASVSEWMDRMETFWNELLQDVELRNNVKQYSPSLFRIRISNCMKEAEEEWERHNTDYVKYGNMLDYCQRDFFFKGAMSYTAGYGKEPENLIETINDHMPEEFLSVEQKEYPYERIWERIKRFNQGRWDLLFGPEGIRFPDRHLDEEWCRICDEKEDLLFEEVFGGCIAEELFVESVYAGIRKAILEKMASDDRFTEEHIQRMAEKLVYESKEKETC